MTRLSVNINKVATLRNARGENVPDVVEFAKACERFGAEGITVHPRPDERHITRRDVRDLKGMVTTEFNIEGYPSDEFMDLVLSVRPAQVTLVPDAPDAVTSNSGWDVEGNAAFLSGICSRLKEVGIRSSIFVNADARQVEKAAAAGADRVELYTKPYADKFALSPEEAVAPFIVAAQAARKAGIGLNAGHDLNSANLGFFHSRIPNLDEVSIGHALISEALYYGLENTIKLYLAALRTPVEPFPGETK